MTIKAAVATALVLAVTACTQEAPVARHTVADYRADKSLRRQSLLVCRNDPGTLGETPDCINAQEAERLESHGSLRDSGPVGLQPKKELEPKQD